MTTHTNDLHLLSLSCLLTSIQTGSFMALLPTLLHATENASRYGTIIGCSSAISLALSFIIGKMSDKIGRRATYRLSLIMTALCPIFVAYGSSVNTQAFVLVGALFSRIRVSRVIARAYVVDLSTPSERTVGLAQQGAWSGIGFVIGPSVGGYLSTLNDTTATSFNAGIALMNLCIVWMLLGNSDAIDGGNKEVVTAATAASHTISSSATEQDAITTTSTAPTSTAPTFGLPFPKRGDVSQQCTYARVPRTNG